MDFSKIKIRCSSLGALFTEPQSKADKDAGKLSATAKAHFIEIYAKELWGVEKDIVTKQMKKGTIAEEDGINLLGEVDKKKYVKNIEGKENDWISGHSDIVEEDLITDTKLAWDAFSFLPKLISPIDKDNLYQVQGYMWLWGVKRARISHCLVNTPDHIIMGEKYRLLRSMDVATEENPEYLKAAAKLESNMKFDHIPIQQRVINQFVDRDESIIEQIPLKVIRARAFLKELHDIHFGR